MEGTIEKICPNCGEKLPGDALFCVKCGTKVDGEIQSVQQPTKTPSFLAKNKKKIVIGVAAVVTVLLILFIVNAVQVFNLKKELMRDWEDIEGSNGVYIVRILDFSEDEIEYRLETRYSWMDTTVATYKYKVVSGNKIKVSRFGGEWKTYTIKFSKDKKVMTVSPALTSVDDEERWFNFD